MRTTNPLDAPTSGERRTVLRGADAVDVGGRFQVAAGALVLVVVAALLLISVVAAANNNGRISRMKLRGLAATVVVTDCTGNLGGSGSNAANYTCRGHYVVDGTPYDEVIGAMTDFAAPGAHVRAVVDPTRHSTVELASAVASSTVSPRVYVIPGLLGLVLCALSGGFLRWLRRRDD